MAGTLFVVATPIGNLEDLSFRALRTLKEVDVIAAEDTRRTSKLLAHYGIRKSMVSLREHNERRETPRLVARLQAGQSVALVSDAGTPGISDPGQHLVRSAREAGVRVSPIPGPSAVMAALSASGEPASEFVFMGFPPRSGSARTKWFSKLESEPRTAVFFEAPHRIERTISDLTGILAIKPINIQRELTKINEELVVCTNATSMKSINPIGEFVIVVGQCIDNKDDIGYDDATIGIAIKMFDCMTNTNMFSDNEAELLVSKAMSLDPKLVRKVVKKARILRRRQEQSLS